MGFDYDAEKFDCLGLKSWLVYVDYLRPGLITEFTDGCEFKFFHHHYPPCPIVEKLQQRVWPLLTIYYLQHHTVTYIDFTMLITV